MDVTSILIYIAALALTIASFARFGERNSLLAISGSACIGSLAYATFAAPETVAGYFPGAPSWLLVSHLYLAVAALAGSVALFARFAVKADV